MSLKDGKMDSLSDQLEVDALAEKADREKETEEAQQLKTKRSAASKKEASK